jgi:dienelactone hydrolase
MRVIHFSWILVLSIFVSCASKPQKNDSTRISFYDQGMTYTADLYLPAKMDALTPMVVVVPEWWGKTDHTKSRGKKLASEGYAALVVDMYGNEKVVDTPPEAQALATPFYEDPKKGVDKLNQYLKALEESQAISPAKIYAIGFCFGGTQVLNWARSGKELAGVASFHGGLTSSMKADAIPSKILVLHGGADPLVPPKDVAAFKEEMKKVKANYKFVIYTGALHAFTNPKATEIGKEFNIPVAYDAKADEASWEELKVFLK